MALSRTPHGILDMTSPALGALLLLGAVPPLPVVLLGILTAFSGYTAVYALNDVVDHRADREKIRKCGVPCVASDLDAVYARHPIAQGLLSLREGMVWTAAWGSVAFLGAYTLNPACALIFLLGCVAEAVYCLLLRVSHLRVLVSGMVKTAGAVAAVFAVSPHPPLAYVLTLFAWFFLWEVGGQNVPNDLSDQDDDRDIAAETLPIRLGPEKSARLVLGTLAGSVVLSLLLYWITPADLHPIFLPGALIAGVALLLVPALRLYRSRGDVTPAAALFNRASYYPPVMFALTLVSALL